MLTQQFTITSLLALLILTLQPQLGEARANVSLYFTVRYTNNRTCDKSVRILYLEVGTFLNRDSYHKGRMYLQDECARQGERDMIYFSVDNLHEPLFVKGIMSPDSRDESVLREEQIVLTSRKQQTLSKHDLALVVTVDTYYECEANYFGKYCERYCTPNAEEYDCDEDGFKLCKDGYYKHGSNEKERCLVDRCRKYPHYCENNSICRNPNVTDSDQRDSEVPICECLNGFTGARCEALVTSAPAIYEPSTSIKVPPQGMPERDDDDEPKLQSETMNGPHPSVLASSDDPVRVPLENIADEKKNRAVEKTTYVTAVVLICVFCVALGASFGILCYSFRRRCSRRRKQRTMHERLNSVGPVISEVNNPLMAYTPSYAKPVYSGSYYAGAGYPDMPPYGGGLPDGCSMIDSVGLMDQPVTMDYDIGTLNSIQPIKYTDRPHQFPQSTYSSTFLHNGGTSSFSNGDTLTSSFHLKDSCEEFVPLEHKYTSTLPRCTFTTAKRLSNHGFLSPNLGMLSTLKDDSDASQYGADFAYEAHRAPYTRFLLDENGKPFNDTNSDRSDGKKYCKLVQVKRFPSPGATQAANSMPSDGFDANDTMVGLFPQTADNGPDPNSAAAASVAASGSPDQ